MFSLVPFAEINGIGLEQVSSLGQVSIIGDIEEKKKLGRRIYKIRNQCVHQEDYEERVKTEVTNECWPKLTLLLFKTVHYFYSNFPADIVKP